MPPALRFVLVFISVISFHSVRRRIEPESLIAIRRRSCTWWDKTSDRDRGDTEAITIAQGGRPKSHGKACDSDQ
jgi:hypothetical protein